MEVYRVLNKKYDPLDGIGAAMVGGRWNPTGTPAVYAARTFEGALLEQLVHANVGKLPKNRRAVEIQIPDDAAVHHVDPDSTPDWDDEAVSQAIGRDWLSSGASAVLVVPSVVARPWGWNVVLNPRHPEFGTITVVDAADIVWDPRLEPPSARSAGI